MTYWQKFNRIIQMKRIILLLIRFYQKVLSPDQGIFSFLFSERFCRFHPTCSEYMIEAVQKFGIFKGSYLGLKRLGRCQPMCEGGFDPVPENPSAQTPESPTEFIKPKQKNKSNHPE